MAPPRRPAPQPIDRVATPAVAKPIDVPTKQLDRSQPLLPPAPRAVAPQPRVSARRAQLPAPGARHQRTAQVHAGPPAPSRRGRNAMLAAAGFLMFAAIGIVVVVGLSGPDIDPNARRGSAAASGSGTSATARAGSGSATRRVITAPAGHDAGRRIARVSARKDAGPRAVGAARKDAGVRRARKGNSVTVESSPGRAYVYLDGVRQCRAKCTVEGLDPTHTYLLSVRRRKYIAWSQLLKLGNKRRQVRIKAYLSEVPDSQSVGYLVVRVKPVADVSVDGTRIGRVTSDGRIPLRPGSHEITLTRGKRKLRFLVDIKRQRITWTEKLVLR